MAGQTLKLNIAKDYSRIVLGRWRRLGPFSGEDFYETMLLPMYCEAVEKGVQLEIELDGTKGYPSSFLDQSFGELAREKGVENVRSIIIFHANVFQWVIKYINERIWDKTK